MKHGGSKMVTQQLALDTLYAVKDEEEAVEKSMDSWMLAYTSLYRELKAAEQEWFPVRIWRKESARRPIRMYEREIAFYEGVARILRNVRMWLEAPDYKWAQQELSFLEYFVGRTASDCVPGGYERQLLERVRKWRESL